MSVVFCPACSERQSNADAEQCDHCGVSLREAAIPIQRFRLQGLGLAVLVAFAVAVLARGLSAWQTVSDLSIGRDAGGAQRAFLVLSAVTILISGALFVTWLWRARKNLEAYPEALDLKVKAWWVIVSLIIPLVGVVFLYHVMRDVALVSTRSRWVAGFVLAGWVAYLAQTPVLLLGPFEVPVVLAALFFAGAGVCLGVFVRAVSRAQTAGMSLE